MDTQILSPDQWVAEMANHEAEAQRRLDYYRHPGDYHPVYDFLFEYYPVRPSHLKRWHPGLGKVLEGTPPHADWRDYKARGSAVGLDLNSWWERRGESAMYIRHLMERTQANPAQFDCFGLHEWAMVYKTENPRHDLPLRLGKAGTNEVVERHRIRCTHYDAFRFFTEPARPLNLTVLSRASQPDYEQAGCVHVSMDLYKWAWKLGALIPGHLLLECLDLAIDARILDMEASPYDCRGLGFGVVAIETPEGKSEYVRRQRQLSLRAELLRDQLVHIVRQAEIKVAAG